MPEEEVYANDEPEPDHDADEPCEQLDRSPRVDAPVDVGIDAPEEDTEDALLQKLKILVLKELIKKLEAGTIRAQEMEAAVRMLQESGAVQVRRGRPTKREPDPPRRYHQEENKEQPNWTALEPGADIDVPFKLTLPFPAEAPAPE